MLFKIFPDYPDGPQARQWLESQDRDEAMRLDPPAPEEQSEPEEKPAEPPAARGDELPF